MCLLNKIKSNSKGFTLIELLVVIFIIGLIMAPLFKIIGWNFEISGDGLSLQKQQEDFRIFNYSIANELLFAKDIKITNNPTYDAISYVKQDGKIETFLFENNGLYRKYQNEKTKIVTGERYDTSFPAVYKESNGMIRFNFYATDIHSLFFLTIRPRLVH